MNRSLLKGIGIGVLAASIIQVSGLASASSQVIKGYFQDRGWWSADAEWAKDHALMTGLSEDRFGGDQPMTRGEMAALLRQLADKGVLQLPAADQAETPNGSASVSNPEYGTDALPKAALDLHLTQQQVENWLGKPQAIVRDAAVGDTTLWRYDLQPAAGYTYETDTDSVDVDGLRDGNVQGQWFFGWNDANALVSITWYGFEKGALTEYRLEGQKRL